MFDPKLSIGQVITEKEVHDIFQCQTTLGIRMSKKNNLFVIMSGSAKTKKYDDVWDGDTLYYYGTDINSDDDTNQTLVKGRGNNNSQLYDVWNRRNDSDCPDIFLFVKQKANMCVYKGPVQLAKKPYMDKRHDDPTRKVWIFPLQLLTMDEEPVRDLFESAETEAQNESLNELKKRIKGKKGAQPETATKKHLVNTVYYERDSDISAYAKVRSNGKCDLCGKPAPFNDKNGHPFLESHHVVWLSNGGEDSIENVVALCPNCHKRIHILNNDDDTEYLLNVIKKYSSY